jgi:hypothetical protein
VQPPVITPSEVTRPPSDASRTAGKNTFEEKLS